MRAAFNQQGDLIHLPYRGAQYTWEEVSPFTAMLALHDYVRNSHRGGHFRWKHAVNGALYPMFIADSLSLIKATLIDQGQVFGNFEVCRRGPAYGIRRLEVKKEGDS
jgi:hypothetical protein